MPTSKIFNKLSCNKIIIEYKSENNIVREPCDEK